MNQAQLAGLIRHVSSLVGGILVTVGVLNQEDLTGITEALVVGSGAVLTLIAIWKSWGAKSKKK